MTPVSTDQHSVILPSIIYNDNVISCLTCAQKLIFLNALVFLCFFFVCWFVCLFVCLCFWRERWMVSISGGVSMRDGVDITGTFVFQILLSYYQNKKQ